MTRIVAFIIFCCFLFSGVHAQNSRYIIRLKDKGTNPFSLTAANQYLSPRSIDRRTRYSIAYDSTDLPVTPRYVDSIRLAGNVQVLGISKWLNCVAIRTTDAAALAKINSFFFVESTQPIAAKNADDFVTKDKFNTTIDTPLETERAFAYGVSNGQVKLHRTDWLHNRGFKGETMQLAVLDAGFYRYNILPTFDSARLNGQVLGTYDFVANEVSVSEDDAHGMQCLSTIVANLPGTFVGTAPKTKFYLFRTEDVASEYPIEEFNFVVGLERADSLGVDVTSTSLGYTTFDNPVFNHTYADMNGNTTIAARGADLGAKKGMLNVISAGNDGNGSWRYISTPADADSVLSVGAVDTLKNVAGFSSYGPSSDGQIKPEVAAVGLRSIIANANTGMPQYGNGTSFACPNMAGVVLCLWQAFPEVNNMSIISALERSATKATNPDDRIGYGIPDVVKSFIILEKHLYKQNVTLSGCNVNYAMTVKTGDDMKVFLERKLTGEANYITVDSLTGNGPFTQKQLSFTNNLSGISSGLIQYRTSMVVGNEPKFILDSASVNLIENCTLANSVTAGPNPVLNDLSIYVQRTTTSEIRIELQNALGQRIYSDKKTQVAGASKYTVPMAHLAAGIYYIHVFESGKKLSTTKIIKQ